MRLHPFRTLIILVTLLLTASSLFALPVASAQGPARDFGAEAGFLSSLNSQRAAGGLGPLALSSSMTAAADSWAFEMANGSFLAHASDIVSGTPGGWTKVGENVGRGQTVSSLTSAFMSSPGHRANIMDTTYTHIGIAVYAHPSDGRIYTTHRFAALPGAAPVAVAPVAAPTVAPTVAPLPTATAVPPTPVPPTPVPPTPVPATPVPATPVPVPATPVPTSPPAPTATPIPPLVTTPEPDPTAIPPLVTTPEPEPTAIPATPVPTAVPSTPVPATPVPATPVPATPVPATPVPATPVPATPVPATPVPETPETAESDSSTFGEAPEQLAFVDSAAIDQAVQAKLASKTAKFGR